MSPRRRPARASALPDVDLNPRREPVLDFRERGFDELGPGDWETLGLLCGLEVHQQLDTARKLFCRCPPGRRTARVDAELLRHMRPTLSEMGSYDGCALMEFKTRKEIVYLVERETACTYEMDDTPPFEIDEEAVRLSLDIARSFGLSLVSELQVMRKQYLDGSIPTGFQRTALVGLGGEIPFGESERGAASVLRIRQLTLEEDSCREVSDRGHRIVFRTDRLGTPLIETVTEPDLRTPRDVAAGVRLLARVARASRRVRRGPGAARQDVNVSIAGSRRVEIKGVSSHRRLARLVQIEAYRHLALLRLRAELERRGLEPGSLALDELGDPRESALVADATSLLGPHAAGAVGDALERGGRAWAVRLPGFRALLAWPTQPGRDFAHELAERVRVIACPSDRSFLAHSDAGAPLASERWRAIGAALRARDEDALVVLWGPEEDVETGVREVLERCRQAFAGVPAETRQARPDGTTGFERLLPGPERMYPDTDTPPLPLPDAWVDGRSEGGYELRAAELPWQREARYVALGLSPEAAHRLLDAPWAPLFDQLAARTAAAARRTAAALEKRLVHFWRETGARALPPAARLAPLVRAVESGAVHPQAFEAVLDRLLRLPSADPQEVLNPFLAADGDGERLAARAVALRPLLGGPGDEPRVLRRGMGRLMPAFRGKVEARRVRGALEEALAADARRAEREVTR